ncbi:D-xylulose reductase [Arboricoccus pini]|uniref:D-xylulose reductase n=1 Tax=Arboricoccus pini TaxID=1963835 RepID=A0A212R7N3_9PROT|nr:NAD(P)-dependent alcohol dehydrogenase [Arboricoccus pini]SNB68201.1 D-xylulose reductase [Arboricoccus pini]
MARALVLERPHELSLRDIDLPQEPGPDDVKIKMHTVGVCGSDVHYYTHGRIGPFVVNAPMVLGHEGSGTVVEVGKNVATLKVGDRVCIEPGVPNLNSRLSKMGLYNLDPSLTFWATPPDHGCLTPYVVFPAAFTYKLPDNVSFAEGAMIEPFAVGMQAAVKARITPGDVGVVMGAGPIGIMIALAALAGGCSQIIIADLVDEKLKIAGQYDGITPVNVKSGTLIDVVKGSTEGWGADLVFDASGSKHAYPVMMEAVRPGGAIVLVGNPTEPVPVDFASLIAKEVRIETVFRYANVYDRAIKLIAGKIDLKPLISGSFPFEESIAVFDRAVEARPTDVKLQIVLDS